MNAVDLAQTAYGSVSTPVRTPRSVEYEAIARITRNLKRACGNAASEYGDLARALHENRRLWTLLGTIVTDEDNQLPDELRARLGYLADFSTQHTSKVLRNEATADVLVEINMAVMSGLQQAGAPS